MLLVGNGTVITRDAGLPYLDNGCVAIKENVIVEVGDTQSIRKKYPAAAFMDAKGKVIMPGMINTHMHLYSTFARGMALKDAPPQNFVEILERLWWRLDKALTLEDVYYSALPVLIDCVKNGTTTIFDHHASPGVVRDSLFILAKAAKVAGVRGSFCYEVSDRDGEGVMREGIRENVEFIKHANNDQDEMVRGMFGLHASMTLSDKTLAACAEANAGTGAGFHVHTAEAASDLEAGLRQYGKSPVERFVSHNMYGPKSIAVHCVHVTERDKELLKETGVNVVHNPESNMGNAVGCSPVLDLMSRGIRVGLGTDGYTSDMFESYKVANILHKHHNASPSVAWAEAPTMLFANNAGIAAEYFSRPLGRLAAGCYADVIIVDYCPPTPLTKNNADGHILFGMSGRSVVSTIINGKVVMENRQLTGIDEREVCEKARQLSRKLWERF
ncbi:Putative aminohydrolase SsnA [Sporomusa rhizae]|uniref:putative aminohydrolase SsnA n=1 Tax=Sporomusa rhizae TaxID=357999 RepID=UPI00352A429E